VPCALVVVRKVSCMTSITAAYCVDEQDHPHFTVH